MLAEAEAAEEEEEEEDGCEKSKGCDMAETQRAHSERARSAELCALGCVCSTRRTTKKNINVFLLEAVGFFLRPVVPP